MIIKIGLGSFEPWQGAVDTFEKVADMGMLDDLESMLEEMYLDGIDETALNDVLWHESERIFEMLGISDDEEEEEEEEEEEGRD